MCSLELAVHSAVLTRMWPLALVDVVWVASLVDVEVVPLARRGMLSQMASMIQPT